MPPGTRTSAVSTLRGISDDAPPLLAFVRERPDFAFGVLFARDGLVTLGGFGIYEGLYGETRGCALQQSTEGPRLLVLTKEGPAT